MSNNVKYEFKVKNTASAELAKVWAKSIKIGHPDLWAKLISIDEIFEPGMCFTLALESIGLTHQLLGNPTSKYMAALFDLADQDRQEQALKAMADQE